VELALGLLCRLYVWWRVYYYLSTHQITCISIAESSCSFCPVIVIVLFRPARVQLLSPTRFASATGWKKLDTAKEKPSAPEIQDRFLSTMTMSCAPR